MPLIGVFPMYFIMFHWAKNYSLTTNFEVFMVKAWG